MIFFARYKHCEVRIPKFRIPLPISATGKLPIYSGPQFLQMKSEYSKGTVSLDWYED